ncbi:MAG: DNA-directed RNA polymerase subunit alpha [Candidatus Levybacteria bacterium RIFCSPHIGHO2_02_FULL_39_36]|nr:MAG: DNA-directed RNA polymerase subunit alpha [Candidatus Levybacteria bacterium GW2011_GWA1_39_11]KKR24996.1 MAG: DNA-directed RNA polymerase subunit alpha [Candidatus Levybacteria bacterium GW2011_GWB1_39_7]KKR27553.1 MAG: DNA-directed RNA polymerase subunit alpha [Microgenomates group bacterium GW2011_GWC1_39_7]KKR48399.1 MAG: DNA-directed RNA polymerase subunit alpha [Candidatus Levybacteria bacterium GW2011_GWA2_40_16]OGH15481.1 MAG: DNA-directed RNA polymerase subunit alpha [Candidatu
MINPTFKTIEEKKEQGYTRFVIEPLEPGFGHTLGVALRRLLLTCIEGAAVTSVKIDSVRHLFSTLQGLKEDVIGLVLNIKTLRVKLAEGKDEARLSLSVSGPGEIKASKIEESDGVEIIDPDHYLGSLSDKKSKLNMEMTVERGAGYSLAEDRKISTVGVIPIDAIFSPILRVNYKIEQTRVGRQTNFDKLILEIWTDGTIEPKEALDEASKILVVYFHQIYEPNETSEVSKIASAGSLPNDVLKMTIDELDLPTRIYNSLRNAGIETVGEMLNVPRKDLMNYRNLGAKSLSIIEESLKERGITLSL